jgi:uncharacterized protein YbaR (Trm112 family)
MTTSPTIPAEVLAILVCPRCKGGLVHRPEVPALDCESCRLRYAVRDGIPVLLVEEAAPLPPRGA